MELDRIIERIRKNELLRPSELLPHLSQERRDDRCRSNYALAEAYAEVGNFEQARIFISRAWILSRFLTDVLPLYIKIHSRLNDIDSIRGAYKRLGMIESSKGNVAGALTYFNQWQYAYAVQQKLDKYQYDFDVLERIEQMAAPLRYRTYPHSIPIGNRKIRLAYLMFGMLHTNSVIVKINRMLAKYHDKERFEVAFFVPEPKPAVYAWRHAIENIQLLKGYGCEVLLAPLNSSNLKRLRGVARQIYDYKPDILMTNAVLAEFEHYFIASLRPAPLVVGLVQGPPAQFAAPSLDWCISWSRHPLIDSPCDCSLVLIGLDLPDKSSLKPYSREDLGLSRNSTILMSAGRYAKFQDRTFWEAIFAILSRFPDLVYVAVGVSKEQVPFLDELVTNDINNRVRLLGWRKDCLNIMLLADVIIDTYPSGGGHVLIDAMALGIPFVSFGNNYMKEFDQTDWSVADEFVDIPELMADRGDFEAFKAIVARLIEDEPYRIKMGNLCREQIHRSMGNPEQGVKKIEDILSRIIEQKLRHTEYHPQKKLNPFQRQVARGMALNKWFSNYLRGFFFHAVTKVIINSGILETGMMSRIRRVYRLFFRRSIN